MQIDQDTFKNDKLYYGGLNSRQRIQLGHYRSEKFTDLFVNDFPEIYLKLQGERRILVRFLNKYRYKSSFKYIGQLSSAIVDSSMETVCSEEFKKLIKRFKNHLHHKSPETIEELKYSIP